MEAGVARESGAGLEEALEILLPLERELAYANFQPVAARPGAAAALHRERFRAAAERGAAFVARGGDGRPLAAVHYEDRPFESEHFGLAMARLEPPVAVPGADERAQALRALYRGALGGLAEAGVAHVAARASTRDRAAGWVLQELGGFHVDTQVSWMAALPGVPHDSAPPPVRIEVHDAASVARIDRACWKTLAEWGGRAFDRGPLVFDQTLPHERALRVYQRWTEQVMAGEWADAVLLARDGAEVVAFISMQHLPDVSEAAGAAVCGRGLGATLPDYRGLFTAIQREMIAARPLGAAYMENETQAATTGSINVYAKLGFRYLRSTSTFHLRLDGRLDRQGPRPCA